MPTGIALLLLAVILIAVSVYLSRRRKALQAELGIELPAGRRSKTPVATQPKADITHFRPAVAEFGVEGHNARVRFDVPLPEGDDEILSELLVAEAIEVVREKRHSLPLAGITHVVALAGQGGEVREVGRAKLDQPGVLPPRAEGVNILNLSILANDPLAHSFSEADGEPAGVRPGVADTARSDELRPLSSELRLPKAIHTGLRAQGIDPANVSPGELVTGLLRLFGYQMTAAGLHSWVAAKGGERTYIVEDAYKPGDHPELDEGVIRRFMVEFASSGTDRGMLVTDKYGPFEIYTLERREPRVRFVTRDRLQKMVDSLALS